MCAKWTRARSSNWNEFARRHRSRTSDCRDTAYGDGVRHRLLHRGCHRVCLRLRPRTSTVVRWLARRGVRREDRQSMDMAMKTGCHDGRHATTPGGGFASQEGVVSLGPGRRDLLRNVRASGVIPSEYHWSSCLSPAVRSTPPPSPTSRSWLTRRRHVNIRNRTYQDGHRLGLGDGRSGRRSYANTSRATRTTCHSMSRTRSDYVKRLLSYLPSNNLDEPVVYPTPRRST